MIAPDKGGTTAFDSGPRLARVVHSAGAAVERPVADQAGGTEPPRQTADVAHPRDFSSNTFSGSLPQVSDALTLLGSGRRQYSANGLRGHVEKQFEDLFECRVDIVPVSSAFAANALSLAALTPPWGIILASAEDRLAGSVDFFTGGAEVVSSASTDGKMDGTSISDALRCATDAQRGRPWSVSISQSAARGATYSLGELDELCDAAKRSGMRVHMDGGRFAHAIAASAHTAADLTWRAGVDVLAFGASGNGTMATDALVVFDRSLTDQLRFRAERAGHGRPSAMPFHYEQLSAYLSEGAWLQAAARANKTAAQLAEALQQAGARAVQGRTNVVTCELPPSAVRRLRSTGFSFDNDPRAEGCVCFSTSFATAQRDLDDLAGTLTRLLRAQAG